MVDPARVERMTPQQTPNGEPDATHRPVQRDRRQRIFTTRWVEPARWRQGRTYPPTVRDDRGRDHAPNPRGGHDHSRWSFRDGLLRRRGGIRTDGLSQRRGRLGSGEPGRRRGVVDVCGRECGLSGWRPEGPPRRAQVDHRSSHPHASRPSVAGRRRPAPHEGGGPAPRSYAERPRAAPGRPRRSPGSVDQAQAAGGGAVGAGRYCERPLSRHCAERRNRPAAAGPRARSSQAHTDGPQGRCGLLGGRAE
jgi:hypothetical protein